MTATVEWFCDTCNASHQVRKPGDEVPTGYFKSPLDTTPPLGWAELLNGKHACPTCVAKQEDANPWQSVRRDPPHESTREDGDLMGVEERVLAASIPPPPGTTWPSRSSPFSGRNPEGFAHGGGVRDDG